jgi:hypothetical protein
MKRADNNHWLPRLGRPTALALFALVPLSGTLTSAEAKPPAHAPAWGYRAKQQGGYDKGKYRGQYQDGRDRDGDDDDRYDRDRYDRDRYNRDDYYRDRYNRDRDYRDRDYRDRYNRDRYDRDRYDRDRYNRNDRNERRTIAGVVTRDLSGDQFEIRSDNGHYLRVDARGDEPRRLSRGDHVVVYGHFDNGRFIAQDVRITRNR